MKVELTSLDITILLALIDDELERAKMALEAKDPEACLQAIPPRLLYPIKQKLVAR